MEKCCLCKHQVFFYTQVRVAVHINFVNAFQKQLLVEYCLGMNHHIAYITRCKENDETKRCMWLNLLFMLIVYLTGMAIQKTTSR